MKVEEFEALRSEMEALSRSYLRRWAWGRKAEWNIIEDVQQEAAVRLFEEMRRLDLSYEPREQRSQALYGAMSRAASQAVNYWRDQLGGRRPQDEVVAYDPRTGGDDVRTTFTKHTVPLDVKLANHADAFHVDKYFEQDRRTVLDIDLGDAELNTVAQGLADGLDYTTIASRLGYDGPHARQFVYRRVQRIRQSATLLEVIGSTEKETS